MAAIFIKRIINSLEDYGKDELPSYNIQRPKPQRGRPCSPFEVVAGQESVELKSSVSEPNLSIPLPTFIDKPGLINSSENDYSSASDFCSFNDIEANLSFGFTHPAYTPPNEAKEDQFVPLLVDSLSLEPKVRSSDSSPKHHEFDEMVDGDFERPESLVTTNYRINMEARERYQPMSREDFECFFDSDGRLVDEHRFKKRIFKGGVNKDVRQDVWNFLFGLYPANTTARERDIMKARNRIQYEALKARWYYELRKRIESDPKSVKLCPDWYAGCLHRHRSRDYAIPSATESFDSFVGGTPCAATEDSTGTPGLGEQEFLDPLTSELISASAKGLAKEKQHVVQEREQQQQRQQQQQRNRQPPSPELSLQQHQHQDLPLVRNTDVALLPDAFETNFDALLSPKDLCGVSTGAGNSSNLVASDEKDIRGALREAMQEEDLDTNSSNTSLCVEETFETIEPDVVTGNGKLRMPTSSETLLEWELWNDNKEHVQRGTNFSLVEDMLDFDDKLPFIENDEQCYLQTRPDNPTPCVQSPLEGETAFLQTHKQQWKFSDGTYLDDVSPLDAAQEEVSFAIDAKELASHADDVPDFGTFVGHDSEVGADTEGACFLKPIHTEVWIENVIDPSRDAQCNFREESLANITSLDKMSPVSLSRRPRQENEIEQTSSNLSDNVKTVDFGGTGVPVIGAQAFETARLSFPEKANVSDGDLEDTVSKANESEAKETKPISQCGADKVTTLPTKSKGYSVLEAERDFSNLSWNTGSYSNKVHHKKKLLNDTSELSQDTISTSKDPHRTGDQLNLTDVPHWIAQIVHASSPASPRPPVTLLKAEEPSNNDEKPTHYPNSTRSVSVCPSRLTSLYSSSDLRSKNLRMTEEEWSKKISKDLLNSVTSSESLKKEEEREEEEETKPVDEDTDREFSEELTRILSARGIEGLSVAMELHASLRRSDAVKPKLSGEGKSKVGVNNDFISHLLWTSLTNSSSEGDAWGRQMILFSPHPSSPHAEFDSHVLVTSDQVDSGTCPYFSKPSQVVISVSGSFGCDLLKSLELEAQLLAARQKYKPSVLLDAVRIIDKDVPRTDRELEYFRGDTNKHLLMLRDALITYSFFHPDVGYAQGMNDIMSQFLVVLNSEPDAYWMFCSYMEHFKANFMEEGMLKKISMVDQLLMKMDRQLYEFLRERDMDLMFCHRWLLLSFKREFCHEDGLVLFEVISSHHLEVFSLEAEMERYKERARELERNEGNRSEEVDSTPEYSFDVFVCVTMLHEYRDLIMQNNDFVDIYRAVLSLPQGLDVNAILAKAEDLFYQYCRKSITDSFQVIHKDEVSERRGGLGLDMNRLSMKR